MTYQQIITCCYISMIFLFTSNSALADQHQGFSWTADLGVGYDSNIYRAPDNAYTDNALPPPTPPATQVVIVPVIQSGIFIPLGFGVLNKSSLGDNNTLITDYNFSGEFYTDSAYKNANEFTHRFRFGDELVAQKSKDTEDIIYAGLILENVKADYVDRDLGLDKTVRGGTINVAERYTYTATGFNAKYDKLANTYKLGLKFKLLVRDFEDPAPIILSEYDHTYISIGGYIKFRLSKPSKLKIGLKYYTYDYDERPTRDLNGRLFKSNPARFYTYNALSFTYSYKINSKLRAYADYTFRTRKDDFLGYHDYTANKFKIRTKYKYSKNLSMKLALTYWDRDYDNAFAFDRRVFGPLSYDGVIVDFKSKYKIDKNMSFIAELNWRDDNSTDLRYDFERSKVIIGMKWEY